MKSVIKVTTTTLILNEDEIEWLKELIQNPIAAPELLTDSIMREKFWNALNK